MRRAPFLAALAAAALTTACGYRPTLYGGGDPGTLGASGSSARVVLYSAYCDGRCEVTWRGSRDERSDVIQGAWQKRESLREGGGDTATLSVRPADGTAQVRRAAIEVDGREVAHGQGAPGTPVTLSAPLAGYLVTFQGFR